MEASSVRKAAPVITSPREGGQKHAAQAIDTNGKNARSVVCLCHPEAVSSPRDLGERWHQV